MYYTWQRWVVGYNSETQGEFLKGILGSVTPERLGMLLALVGGALLSVMSFLVVYAGKRKPKQSFVIQMFQQVEKAFAAKGCPREQGETVRAYFSRAEVLFPWMREMLSQYLCYVEKLNYAGAGEPDRSQLERLKLLTKALLKALSSGRPSNIQSVTGRG